MTYPRLVGHGATQGPFVQIWCRAVCSDRINGWNTKSGRCMSCDNYEVSTLLHSWKLCGDQDLRPGIGMCGTCGMCGICINCTWVLHFSCVSCRTHQPTFLQAETAFLMLSLKSSSFTVGSLPFWTMSRCIESRVESLLWTFQQGHVLYR